MWVEIRRDLEISFRTTFNTEPRTHDDMHQVMKEQLVIDNKHAGIRKRRQEARKTIREQDWDRSRLLAGDVRTRQIRENWDEAWNDGVAVVLGR